MHCAATTQNIKNKDKILKPFRDKSDISSREIAIRPKLIPQHQQSNQRIYKSTYQ